MDFERARRQWRNENRLNRLKFTAEASNFKFLAILVVFLESGLVKKRAISFQTIKLFNISFALPFAPYYNHSIVFVCLCVYFKPKDKRKSSQVTSSVHEGSNKRQATSKSFSYTPSIQNQPSTDISTMISSRETAYLHNRQYLIIILGNRTE